MTILKRIVLLALLAAINCSGKTVSAQDALCTAASKARLDHLTASQIPKIAEFLFVPKPQARLPRIVFKWPRGIRVMLTGIDHLTKSDLSEIRRAKTEFQTILGPTENFLAFRDLLGNPYLDKSAFKNFLFYFYDGSAESEEDWSNIRALLGYALGTDKIATSAIRGLQQLKIHTFIEVHPNDDGSFDRGLAVVDLQSARRGSLSSVVTSLLSIATSPALSQHGIDWIEADGALRPGVREAVRDYIAFVYCSGIDQGASESRAIDFLSRLAK